MCENQYLRVVYSQEFHYMHNVTKRNHHLLARTLNNTRAELKFKLQTDRLRSKLNLASCSVFQQKTESYENMTGHHCA